MDDAVVDRKGFFLSIRFQILIPLTLLFAATFLLTYLWLKDYLTDFATRLLQDEVQVEIARYQDCLNGDQILDFITEPQYDESMGWPVGMSDPYHQELLNCVTMESQYGHVYSVIVYHSPEAGVLETVVNSWEITEPNRATHYGDPIPSALNYADFFQGLEQQTFAQIHFHYTNPQDSGAAAADLKGFAPIHNTDGKVVGGLAVSVAGTRGVINMLQIRNALIFAFLGSYLVLFVFFLFISSRTTAPLRTLSRTAEQVGEGQYEAIEITPRLFKDEVSTLTQVFTLMISKVQVRENELRQQVTELKIIIDADKRARQVREITESEFFTDLKTRASQLRSARSKSSEGPAPAE